MVIGRTRRRALVVIFAATTAALAVFPNPILKTAPAHAVATIPTGFHEDVVASGFTMPTSIVPLPDGRILVGEKAGLIKVIKNGSVLPTPFIDLRAKVNNYSDRGFVGMAADPNFASNHIVYFFYPYENNAADPSGLKTGRLTKVVANGDVAGPETIILGSITVGGCIGQPAGADCIAQDWYGHAEDSIRFAADGTMFVSLGDAASWDYVDDRALRAQDIDQYNGKILHITTDGKGIATNPFWNGNPDAVRSKVWAYGLRNPFRMTLQPGTGLPVVGDVGWNGTKKSTWPPPAPTSAGRATRVWDISPATSPKPPVRTCTPRVPER